MTWVLGWMDGQTDRQMDGFTSAPALDIQNKVAVFWMHMTFHYNFFFLEPSLNEKKEERKFFLDTPNA